MPLYQQQMLAPQQQAPRRRVMVQRPQRPLANERIVAQQQVGQVLQDEHTQFLYHRKQIAVTKDQTVTYFKDIGSGVTRLDTNLDIGGMLSSAHEFDIWGMSLVIAFATPLADMAKFYNYTFFEMKLSGRVYFEGPAHMLPSCAGLRGVVATTKTNKEFESYSNGEAHPMAYLPINVGRKPLRLPEQFNFYVSFVIAAPTDFSAVFYSWLYLHGIYRKNR